MPRKFIAGMIIGSAICIIGAYYIIKPEIYVHPKVKISNQAKWITVADIKESLKNTPPINVGFDIDDTVVFPKTSFHVYFEKHCPDDNRPYRPNCTNNSDFWDHLNSSGELAPAKEIGKELIEMHKSRGDKIFFITAREKSKLKPETMTKTLAKTFNLENPNKVIYLGLLAVNPDKPVKSKAIIENNIKIFYGDSDSDIAAAIAANIRGIRVLRAPNSQDNQVMPVNGRYGEEVIIGSDI